MRKVAFLMGSASDFPRVEKGIAVLRELEIDCDVRVLSAHRVPQEVSGFSLNAESAGFGVIICAAGLAAHLAGAVAAHTILPVIGLPLSAGSLQGLDALLSTVQMPPGIPVATVGIDAAVNAAVLAAQILALKDKDLNARIIEFRRKNTAQVILADKEIREGCR
ncbi:MAG: 5-(carboxyamino)imidazole ribonucleotide mutase [Candidatus Wallbacteria bacterium]|nr:5-(carboxyamino)imidazole ribonucleotide mutase [Candidatus Wallbacteria bacterium]